MKKNLKLTALLAAVMTGALVPMQASALATQENDMYCWGNADGALFSDMTVVDDKGLFSWVLSGERLIGKNDPYSVCIDHIDQDRTRNVYDPETGEIKEETYHVLHDIIYCIAPRSNYLTFRLRDGADREAAEQRIAEILRKYYPELTDRVNTTGGETQQTVVFGREDWFDGNRNPYYYLADSSETAGSQEIADGILHDLAAENLVDAFYTWGQTAYYQEMWGADKAMFYRESDLTEEGWTEVTAWLTEHHPDYQIVHLTEEEAGIRGSLYHTDYNEIIPPDGTPLPARFTVAADLYEQFRLSGQWSYPESGTSPLTGVNALAGLEQYKDYDETLVTFFRRIAGWDDALLSDCCVLSGSSGWASVYEFLTPKKAYQIGRARYTPYRVTLRKGTTLDADEVLSKWKEMLLAEGYPQTTLDIFKCEITESDGAYLVSTTQDGYRTLSLTDCLKTFTDVRRIEAQFGYYTHDRVNIQCEYSLSFGCTDEIELTADSFPELSVNTITYRNDHWYLTLTDNDYTAYFNAAKYLLTLDLVQDLRLLYASTEMADAEEDHLILIPEPEILYDRGNVNDDTSVDVADAVLLARFCAEDEEAMITEAGRRNADADGDGDLTLSDVTTVLRMIAKLI